LLSLNTMLDQTFSNTWKVLASSHASDAQNGGGESDPRPPRDSREPTLPGFPLRESDAGRPPRKNPLPVQDEKSLPVLPIG
jgi:hypothetical protein